MYTLIISLCFFISCFFFTPPVTHAASKTVPKKTTVKSNSAGVSITKSRDKKSVTVTFNNLKDVKSISYILSYDTRDNTEGAVGTIKTKGAKSVSRKLLFGTCSSGVCRYHKNISNVMLEVTFTTKKGSFTKTYPIKL